MIRTSNTLLIHRPYSEADIEAVKIYINQKNLTREDVKLKRIGSIIELRTIRETDF